jgi:hypothetical protein
MKRKTHSDERPRRPWRRADLSEKTTPSSTTGHGRAEASDNSGNPEGLPLRGLPSVVMAPSILDDACNGC